MTDQNPAQSTRQSIAPTYDHRETGDRFTVESRVNGHRVSFTPTADPFVSQRLAVGWWDLLRSLARRRLVVETIISGDSEIVEDVLELNDDYLGQRNSTRRRQWNAGVERGLGDLAASPSGDAPMHGESTCRRDESRRCFSPTYCNDCGCQQ